MNEAQTETTNFFEAKGIMVKELLEGNIVFFNSDLVTAKTIEIMCKAVELGGFERTGHGLFSVIFREDGRPIPEDGSKCQWMFFPDTYSAVCNLVHLFDRVVEIGQGEKSDMAKYVSFRAEIWKSILTGFFHELHHADKFLEEPDLLRASKEAKDEEEETADDFAREMIISLAKEYDIEPSFTPEMESIIDQRWAEEIELAETDDDEKLQEWAKVQKYMRQNGLFMHIPEEDHDDFNITNFKDLMHIISGDDGNDEDWLKGTTSVQNEIPGTTNVSEVTMDQPASTDAAGDVDPQMPEAEWDTPWHEDVPGMQGVVNVYDHEPQVDPQPAPNIPTPPAEPVTPAAPAAPAAPTSNVGTNPAAVVGEAMYQAPQMPNEGFQETVKGLYLKLFTHIFQNCGYAAGQTPFFNQGARIADQIPLTEAENKIVKEMVCYNGQGQRTPGVKVTNWVSGVFIDKAMTLPGFDLTLTDPNGVQITRKFIPQNPNKTKADGNLSMTAQWAREGHQILWVIDPDNKDKQYAMRVFNGQVESNVSGKWASV